MKTIAATNKQKERVLISFTGERTIKGLTRDMDRSRFSGNCGQYQFNGINVLMVIRIGINKRTSGGYTLAGFTLEGSDEVYKSIPKMIEHFKK